MKFFMQIIYLDTLLNMVFEIFDMWIAFNFAEDSESLTNSIE